MNEQFKILRFGFINYFGYKSQEIKLDDGIGVIQGSNGTGKTITVSSLLPSLLTLDLKKSMNMNKPSRAGREPDAFVGTTESPSYIWMEVGNDKYKKTIAGTYRTKNPSGIEQKGIIFKDNINVNERMFSSNTGEVYSFRQFKDLNEDLIEGIYEWGQRDAYAKRINELFYGFEDIADYNRNIDIIYNLENATQGNETIDLKYIEENLKSILPDYEKETNDQIIGFINTVKNNKEAKEKKEIYERNAELLDNINNLVNNYNYKYIKDILKWSNILDEKLKTLEGKIERTKEKKKQQEEEFNELITRRKNIQTRLESIKQEKLIIDIDDINDITNRLNEAKEKINAINKRLNNNKKSLNRVKINISNKNEHIDGFISEIHDINRTLDDKGDKVLLLKEKPTLLEDIKKQITFIKELDETGKENSQDKFRLESLEKSLSESQTELSETDEYITKEIKSLQNKLIEWLEKLSINIPKEFSIDYFIENNHFKEQVNRRRDDIKENKNRLERDLEELYDNKKELEDNLKELENNIKPKSYSKHEGGYELYECIDFKDNIDNDLKLKIEGALRETNLLFVVFNPQRIEYGYNYTNGTSLIKPSDRLISLFNISRDLPDCIRENVFEFLDNIYINFRGNVVYQNIEIIPKEIRDNIEYIGEKQRERKRQQDIVNIHDEIDAIEENINNKKASLERFNDTLKDFDDVVIEEPSFKKLNDLKNNYKNIINNIDKDNKELEEVNKKLENYNSKVKEINDKMYEYLPKNSAIYEFRSEVEATINNQKELKFYEDSLTIAQKELDNYIEEQTSINEDIGMEEVELEKATNSKEQFEKTINSKEVIDKINELDKLKNEETSLNDELSDKLKKEGVLETRVKHIEDELQKETNSYEASSKEKEAKDLLMESHKIKNFSKPSKIVSINKFDSDLNKYSIEFDNQPHNSYTIEVNRDGNFKFNTETASTELVNIQNAYQQLKEINFKIENETYRMGEVEKEFIEELEKCRKLVDENTSKQLQLFSGTTIVGPINKTVTKAFDIAKEIQEEMNNKEQNDYMSFFIEYKITDKATAFQKAFFKKNSNKADEDYIEKLSFFIEDLASKIEKAADEGRDKSEIEELVFNELNYKNIIDVKIYHKLNKNAERKPLNKKAMASISEGQRRRAMLEPMFIVLKKNLDKADLKENALSILLLDEGFNKMDYEQQQLLEETIYKSFGTVLIASSTTTLFGPKNGSKIVNYIFLNKIVSKDGSEVIYVDKPKSVVISYE